MVYKLYACMNKIYIFVFCACILTTIDAVSMHPVFEITNKIIMEESGDSATNETSASTSTDVFDY